MPLHNTRSIYAPYCLEKAKGGYIALNREYLPLGLTDRNEIDDWSKYIVPIKGLGPAKAKQISFEGNPNIRQIFLYNDGCIPTRSPGAAAAYFKRLSIFYTLKVPPTR